MYKYEIVVMGFLLDRPMHGYQIKREVRTHRMDSWARISQPLLYQTIAKLEKKGMIQNSKVEREGRMPERRIYQLTSKGKDRLASLVEKSLMEKDLTKDLSNLGYFFLFALPRERALACLKQRKALCEGAMNSLRKRLEAFKGKTSINRLLVIEKDLGRYRSDLSYVKEVLTRMESSSQWSVDAFV